MIIKELNLLGFGKFTNKRIKLSEGINIIYGENENGKTTIHNFINGMFYGFLKPYVKRAIYLDEHEMYRPWSGKRYSGIISFETDGREYLIEREFTKSEETTKVLLERTGENISNLIDTKDRTRIVQPGNYFFGFNDAVYGNTISIKQSESIVEQELSREIEDKLINLSTSLDKELSPEKALAEIEASIKEIGSIRAQTSYYGRNYIKLGKLEEEKQEILKDKDDYLQALEIKTDLDERIEQANIDIKVLEESLKKISLYEKLKIYKDAKNIKEEILNLEDERCKLEEYKGLSFDDYLIGVKLDEKIKNINKRNMELEKDLLEINKTISKTENEKGSNISLDKAIVDDFLEYEELEEESNRMGMKDKSEIEFLKRDIKTNKEKSKASSTYLLLAGLASLGSIVLSFIANKLFLAINIISLPLMMLYFNKKKQFNNLIKEQEVTLGKLEKDEAENKTKIINIEEKKRLILDKYEVNNKLELKKIYDIYNISFYRNSEKYELIEEYNNRKNLILEELEKYKREYRQVNASLKLILKNNFSLTLDQLKNAVDKAKAYKELKVKANAKDELLQRTLGSLSFEDLDKELKNIDIVLKDSEIGLSSSNIKDKLKDKYANLSEIKIERSSNDSRLEILEGGISKLVEIEESISNIKNLLKSLDEKIESLILAADTIRKISKEIQSEYAPVLNERVGSIVKRVTNGRYSKVKIDDKLEMGVIDDITNEIISIKDLSGGTIDQIYFALRFGIIDSLTDKKPPLILDDCFVQYDNSRLENMMELLLEEAKTRQVILFTCHKRESEVLYKKKTKFNLVDLSIE